MGKKLIMLEGIGECAFVKSKRTKKIRIKVEPHKPITTFLPTYVSYDFAYSFVISKKDWLKKAKIRVAELEKQKTIFTPETQFNTRSHKLRINLHASENLKTRIANGYIDIKCPENIPVENANVQEFIRKAIIEAYRIEAKQIFPKKLRFLADKYGYSYNNLAIKNLKTRWGSCSAKNNINLNLHLVRLPEHLLDYVLLHELVHTVHKNHGKYFWDTLNKHVGNAKVIQQELRNYSTEF